jgi:uncharacterized membrane protein YtjA (UPF0391 family)
MRGKLQPFHISGTAPASASTCARAGTRGRLSRSGGLFIGNSFMIKWILILLIAAAVLSLLGFHRLAGVAATGAKLLIAIVLILFLLVVLGLIALA